MIWASRAEIAAGTLDVRISDSGRPTIMTAEGGWEAFRPSVNAAHGWTIIERERIPVAWYGQPGEGLVAAMRAYLARIILQDPAGPLLERGPGASAPARPPAG